MGWLKYFGLFKIKLCACVPAMYFAFCPGSVDQSQSQVQKAAKITDGLGDTVIVGSELAWYQCVGFEYSSAASLARSAGHL